ncbi:hypothetical protein PJN92_27505, partial [Mycobacterium kansasii]
HDEYLPAHRHTPTPFSTAGKPLTTSWASGADLRYVQKTMGHSTPTVTANIYSDLYSDELDHVATNLDRLQDVAKNRANGQEPDTPNHP